MSARADGIMTVAELIAKLVALPEPAQNYIVIADGCDCEGAAGSIRVSESDRAVVIERHVEYSAGGYPNE